MFLCLMFQSHAQRDTVRLGQPVSKYVKQSIAPAAMIGLGMYLKLHHTPVNNKSIQADVVSNFPNFHTSFDDYVAYAAYPMVYGFDWAGIKATTDFKNRTAILCKAEVLVVASVYALKYGNKELRPDGSDDHSFPSGHTAQAFLGAVFLQKELGKKSIVFPIIGYTMATTVGVMRVLNNEHYLGDVLVGAGIGMLGGHIAYWTHRYKWNKNITVRPTYSQKTAGVRFAMVF
jgi:hypothetical protein